MAVFKALGSGVRSTGRRVRILADLWIINVVFAALVAAPFFLLLQADLGHSDAGFKASPLDFLMLGDLSYKYQDASPVFLGGFLVPLVLFGALYVFLNGGIVGRLVDRDGPSRLRDFLADCGKYFWRFLRLFLLSLPFYAVALGLVLNLLKAALRPLKEGAWTELPVVIASNTELLAGLLLLTLVQLVFDYARIAVVTDDDPKVLHALGQGFRFLGGRFFRAWGLYLLIALGFVAGTVVYFAVDHRIPGEGLLFLAAGLAWMQIYVLFRIWTKMLFFAAQAEYFRLGRPEAAPAPAAD
jgi:hypothetical protein